MKPDWLDTPEGPIALRWGGLDAGPPILWVHGYTLDSSLWAPLWEELPDLPHLALDLPGHGASRAFSEGDSFTSLAQSVHMVADAFGARALVGLSFGGSLCLELAASLPDRFDKMVLCSPALPGGPEDQASADCSQELLRMAREQGLGPWLADRWLGSPPAIFDGARGHRMLWEAIQAVVRRHRWDELPSSRLAPRTRGIERGLAGSSTDMRILIGSEDMASFVRTATLLTRLIRGASIDYIDEAGHLAPLERPRYAAMKIAAFLTAPLHQSPY